ncbi:hypothetical protein [Marinobacter algicola]|jgi:hypothetical protein|uniref:Uncharacterized protein n=1 Tax=Marinobacter algicola DG893 TaxID=443152 RepID=A6EUI5_9GAMM|nr:hypothetical protein [Marinobacter algicola]EDM49484.1 hypothetical protein MDG893_09801 [Marinobacter algicola DG893]MBH84147.1 hypothetical protein [Alteromonadaceae bacterium]|tara:strand:+ start:153 stop:392 length:240 start_codon:yes stop_codon:yes gene_type:complete
MKKVSVILIASFLGTGASIVLAGDNGGQADRYNEARSYPDKSIDERTSDYRFEESETVKKLKEEHRIIKELVADLLEKQ